MRALFTEGSGVANSAKPFCSIRDIYRGSEQVRPIILTFTAHYLPGFKGGGPIRTIASMVEQLGDEFDFHIVTSDRDLGDISPFPSVKTNTWIRHGRAHVFYASNERRARRTLSRSLKDKSVSLIYLNSLFSLRATLFPLLQWRVGLLPAAPVLLAPRGELSPGALGIKALKKKLFLRMARTIGLYKSVVFHSSSELEAKDIRREFPNARVMVAPNLSERGGVLMNAKPLANRDAVLRVAFLSRVSPKKNLLFALRILGSLSTPTTFDIFGIIEDREYWSACERVIETLPNHIQAKFQRELRPEDVEATLAAYDLFLFPTLGENYGHVIREALSAGLPVLTSDQTPWMDLETRNAGAALSLDNPRGFVAWIEKFARLGSAERNKMRESAHAYGNDEEKAAQDRMANQVMMNSVLGL